MIKRSIIICCLVVFTLFYETLNAQVFENFSDGNFSSNPAWTGNTADWTINTALQLQSNNTTANSSFYLSTANTLAMQAQWELSINLAFNTSSANYVDVFLIASQSELAAASNTGYFVRIGNTDDDISLYRKDGAGAAVKIIDGINGITNTSNNNLKIKVLRTAGNQFSLFRDITGTGSNYALEGTVADVTYTTSAFFGILIKQSTATFFQKHFVDDIEIKLYSPDVAPPVIQSVNAPTANTLNVLFNEPVDAASVQNIINYNVNNGIGAPSQAVRDANNPALVQLSFATTFANGFNNTITINGVKDMSGNSISNGTATFSFFIPQRYDVMIDEIFADPTPVISLPNAEYIEIKNTSGLSINLQGWKVSNASSVSGALPSYVLPADSFVVITSTSAATLFNGYGRVIGVTSFPSLDNTGTTLSLISKENVTIHAVSYNVAWYQNAVKSDGGWSLEMIDTKNPCSGASNWKASTDLRGGTPGTKNSVDGINKDQTPPALLRAAAPDNTTLLLTFDEPLDSATAATAGNYSISNGIGAPATAITLPPMFNQVQLKLTNPVERGKVYTITVSNVSDCGGNIIQAVRTAKVGLASVIDSLDIVINEVLFNPTPSTVDYVELYNRSNKIFDLKDVFITNRSSTTNALGSLKQLSADNLLFFPGDFYVISENGELVKQAYTANNPGNFINVSPMPSFPDDKGVVVLLNAQGIIVDEFRYDAKWHFELLDNEEGISLERIDYNKPTQSKENWHSAASTAGFGTPSYQNSQFRADVQVQAEITVTPKTFSPDNDGTDDFTTVSYQMTELGYVANITIFDAGGRPVKNLAKNATLALKGSFRWDGLDDKMNKLPIGTYVIYTEVFNLNGKKKNFKNPVVLARRF